MGFPLLVQEIAPVSFKKGSLSAWFKKMLVRGLIHPIPFWHHPCPSLFWGIPIFPFLESVAFSSEHPSQSSEFTGSLQKACGAFLAR